MITASSAACEGATANAVIASAPMAAAQSERRLKRLRDMGFPLGRGLRRLRAAATRKLVGLPARCPKIRGGRGVVTADGHEFVNKFRISKALPPRGTLCDTVALTDGANCAVELFDGCRSGISLWRPLRFARECLPSN